MKCSGTIDPSTFIAPYINSCYNDSIFCDLIVTCAENKSVLCHKLVLCSLSKKLLSICTDVDQLGNLTSLHIEDVSYKDVKDTIDQIYANMGREEVELDKNGVTSMLGIEGTYKRQQLKRENHDCQIDDDFRHEGLDLEDFVKSELTFDSAEYEELDGKPSLLQQLESLHVVAYHDYTGTRQEFWDEYFVKLVLQVSFRKLKSILLTGIKKLYLPSRQSMRKRLI